MGDTISSRTAQEIARTFSIFDPALNPPEEYDGAMQKLRKECPVAWSEEHDGYWVASDYESVSYVLRNPQIFSSHEMNVPRLDNPLGWTGMGPAIPQGIDLPRHTGYRKYLNPLMTHQRAMAYEPRATELARGLLEGLVAKGGGEVMEDFSIPYVSTVALEYLGFPTSDLDQLREWMYDCLHRAMSPDENERRYVEEHSRPAFVAYLDNALEERTKMDADSRPDDVITGMAFGKFGVRPLSRNEQMRQLLLLMVAALDTTTNVLGASMWFLASNPDHFKQLAEHPELIPNAVEELGRYFNVAHFSRECVEKTEVGGQTIEVGQMIFLNLPSAGRDEKFYEHPEIDFTRTARRHLTFGAGPHRCAGSNLARVSMRVALEQLVAVVPSMSLAKPDDVAWSSSLVHEISNIQLTIPAS